jgi:hypothetical protein
MFLAFPLARSFPLCWTFPGALCTNPVARCLSTWPVFETKKHFDLLSRKHYRLGCPNGEPRLPPRKSSVDWSSSSMWQSLPDSFFFRVSLFAPSCPSHRSRLRLCHNHLTANPPPVPPPPPRSQRRRTKPSKARTLTRSMGVDANPPPDAASVPPPLRTTACDLLGLKHLSSDMTWRRGRKSIGGAGRCRGHVTGRSKGFPMLTSHWRASARVVLNHLRKLK